MRRDGFFGSLNYTSANEDWRTEARALQVRRSDTVLCVTGGGDRPLNLLSGPEPPVKIVAIDRNGAQSSLLELKMAAMGTMEYDEYVRFLGLTEAEPRWRLSRANLLAKEMSPAARSFWSRNTDAVAEGVLYSGRWERYFRKVAFGVRAVRREAVERLCSFGDIQEQRVFVARRWNRRWWRTATSVLLSRPAFRLFLGDPAFFRETSVSPGRYLHERMTGSLIRYIVRENFMVSMLLSGRLSPEDLPPYLDPVYIPTIAKRLDRLEVVTDDLVSRLKRAAPGTYSRFSMSDFGSFAGSTEYERVLKEMVRTSVPGARFCVREFLVRHAWPGIGHREPELEVELSQADRAFAYDFRVGTLP